MITLLKTLTSQRPQAADDVACIYCPCRPHVGLCGTYIDTPTVDDIDGSECPECLAIVEYDVCPSCRCGAYANCDPCKESCA